MAKINNSGLHFRPDLFGLSPVKMLALSWRQPYVTMMLLDKIETRRWATKYRGPVLICTSKKAYNEDAVLNISGPTHYSSMMKQLVNHPHITSSTIDLNGYAIAVGTLHNCIPMKEEYAKRCFVKFDPTLWMHIYTDVKLIEPFEWKGTQGWKTVTEEILKQIKYI